ncbi:hypothetical protein H2203_007927 [Taxawa tesnikishii (nom. ined.)]|nr:hypothetical protein H2203_007927 [Dothideales sp. JES 119]
MASSFYTSSPTILLPPQQTPDQYFHPAHYQQATATNATPSEAFNNLKMSSLPPTPSGIAGRKRSRGDIYGPGEEHHEDGSMVMSSKPPKPRGEPVYGPGMTLIYPNDPGYSYYAEGSQSGTWVDEKLDQPKSSPQRPMAVSRKSQRLDRSAPGLDDIARANQQFVRTNTADEPLIDEATRMLGISWIRMDATESSKISQRAYTKWIQRHYPILTHVDLWFENNAIPGYLASATNTNTGIKEYYLFSHDLHQAVLITRKPEELIASLSQPQLLLQQAENIINANLDAPSPKKDLPSPPSMTLVPETGGMELD